MAGFNARASLLLISAMVLIAPTHAEQKATRDLLRPISSTVAPTGTVAGAFAGCLTTSELDVLVGALMRNDKSTGLGLFAKGACFYVEGLRYTLLESGNDHSQIEVTVDGERRNLWVPNEALATAAAGEDFSLAEYYDRGAIAEARANIISTGRPCPAVLRLWHIVQNGQIRPGLYKASCSNNRDYQLTILHGALYVKDWTGVLLGQ